MNAQSNHPGNDTTDPQFLGPEAGQQAGGEIPTRSELDANGSELHRYFSVARGALISVRSNGVTLCRQVDDEWRVLSRKKGDVPLAQWVVNKQAALSNLSRWQLDIDELPSMEDLMAWNEGGICETPTGHRVEPDGTGPDGVPSLRISAIVDACFRLIVDGVSAPSWTGWGCAQARSSMYLSRPRSV